MLNAGQSLKEMAAEVRDIVDFRKTILDAIDNPVLEMARQMRREEEERMQAVARFADAGIAESARMGVIASEAESAFRRSGAEEACAAITEQQKLMQLALPDPKLADYLTSACPQNLIDRQTMQLTEMTELAPKVDSLNLLEANDLTNRLLRESIAAATDINLAIHFGNVYTNVFESYAVDATIAQLRDVERMVRRWQPTEKTYSHAPSPRHEKADRTAPDTTAGRTNSQPANETPTETTSGVDSHCAALKARPPVATLHGFTIAFAVESATRLFVARQLAEVQLGIISVCAIVDEAMSADERKKGGLAQRWINDPEPQSVLEALELTYLRELIAVVTHIDLSTAFNLNPSDRKLLKVSLFRINTLRNQVSHCRAAEDSDALLTELKELASVVFRLIRCPLHVDALLYDIRDVPTSRTLH
jgi:hypothetical protein